MNRHMQARKPLYPLFSFHYSLFILIMGLMLAKYNYTMYLLLGIYLFFFIFGYHKACLGVLPFIIILGLIFLVPKIASHSLTFIGAKITISRLLSFFISIIPLMGIIPIELIRSMRELKISKKIILGALIIFNFFAIVKKEVRTCKSAIKTRANKKRVPPRIIYRAYIIPLITSLIKLSETISMSIETRGFSLEASKDSIYKNPQMSYKDLLFTLFFLTGSLVMIFL